ncbi:C40 family peptidase [Mycobacterium sp. Marseille-P9652]|uniref:C40 family peptidase n=1 Tax=Mycobacterium sp. Marseille-P9652 TaxID=2654950 RepID=UPI0012E866B0|nr:C40 family peptidase [Mycobacterium sp. Marseille-P9652]
MTSGEIDLLRRAHEFFAGDVRPPAWDVGLERRDGLVPQPNHVALQYYRDAVERTRQRLLSAVRIDAAAAEVVAKASRDRSEARRLTRGVLDEARADTVTAVSPLAQREAMRRRAARLRTQRGHVLSARLQARRHAAALRALRYRLRHRGPESVNGRAALAVRAALSRLGRPYVWGATGPEQFDCSGLVQWSYAQAGVHLDRSTYQQINDGIPVPRSQVRPGDLVFPHAGHVQLAIGNNLVVEAPYSGASVRISRMGANVAIRRPL